MQKNKKSITSYTGANRSANSLYGAAQFVPILGSLVSFMAFDYNFQTETPFKITACTHHPCS